MDENFSSRVKDVIQYSKEEAIRLGHNYIGTEHLLLGMIREGEGVAIDIIIGLGVELKSLRKRIEELSSSEVTYISSTVSNIPLTKQAEKALKTTFLEAKLYNSELIGTTHLLLCILRNESDPMTHLFGKLGVTYESVKEKFEQRTSNDTFEDSQSDMLFSNSMSD